MNKCVIKSITSHYLGRYPPSSSALLFEAKRCMSTSSTAGKLVKEHLSAFQQILGNREGGWVACSGAEGDDVFLRYNRDWTKKYLGKSALVLKPTTTEEVSNILRYCQEHSIGVVPQGGNTSLVGGAIALYEDDIIISLEKMNKIIHHDPIGGILTCEAGCILQDLESFLHQHTNCTLPYDLGAKGSCQIGGNVATNAGGLRLIRYGNLHGLVLGLEVVLPTGEIFRQNMISMSETAESSSSTSRKEEMTFHTSLRKDNTGFDLKQVFIGSEGCLGIITKISIHTPPKSLSNNVAVLHLHPRATMHDIANLFVQAKSRLNEILSAFEFWDDLSARLVRSYQQSPPAGDLLLSEGESSEQVNNRKYILIETMGSREEHDQEKLLQFLEEELERSLPAVTGASSEVETEKIIQEGIIAKDLSEVKTLWSLRELIPLSAASHPETVVVFKYDLSLPQLYMYEPVLQTRARLQQWWSQSIDSSSPSSSGMKEELQRYFLIPLVIGFGHFGDGNIHLNVLLRKQSLRTQEERDRQKALVSDYIEAVKTVLEPWIYQQITRQWKGSISAEHGLGLQKASYLSSIKSPVEFALMSSLKTLFDPKDIMNRGKVFPKKE